MPGAPARAAAEGGFLRLEAIGKAFDGVMAVDGVSLDVAKGEVVALLGASGCGKSTLLRLLAGFESPTAGRVLLAGRDLAGVPPRERPTNLLFPGYALFPHLSVERNIAFGLEREGLKPAEVRDRVRAMLHLVQLEPHARHRPPQLDSELQMRVALARVLARQPQVLLLDEPLGALDRMQRAPARAEMARLIASIGATCVVATQDHEEAMALASRVAVMDRGRVLQVGTPTEVYEAPATRVVARCTGPVNLMDGTLAVDEPDHCVIGCADVRHYVGHGMAGRAGMRVTVALRPEKIHLSHAAPNFRDYNAVQGSIGDVVYFGGHTVYRLRLPSGATLEVARANTQRHRDDPLARGDTAWAHWSRTAQVVLTQ